MKHKIYLLILGVVSLVFASCYEDKGNYDYKNLTEVVFDPQTNNFEQMDEDGEWQSLSYLSIRLGDAIHIRPVYTLSKEDPNIQLKFTWKLGDDKVIGTEEELQWTPDEVMSSTPINLDVEDVNTGAHFLASVSISVSEPYSGYGFLILSEKDGEKILSFIAGSYMNYAPEEYADVPFDEFIDIYKTVNKQALPDNAFKIHEHYRRSTTGNSQAAAQMIVCDDELVDIDSYQLTELARSNEFFSTPITGIKDVKFMQWLDLIQDEQGRLYQRRKTTDELFHSQKFLSEPMKYQREVLEQIRLIPGSFANYQNFALVYDGKKHRYLAISDLKATNYIGDSEQTNNIGKIVEVTSAEWPEGFTPLDNMEGYEIIYTDSHNDEDSYSWRCVSIIRNMTTGIYYYQKFDVVRQYMSDGTFLISVENCEQDKLPQSLASVITAQTKYALLQRFTGFDGSQHPYLFAAEGKDLYLYDLEDMEQGVTRPLTFESPIVALEGYCTAGSYLGVALEDGSFYIITTDQAKNHWSWDERERLVRYKVDTGKLGKIIDVSYKRDGYEVSFSAY